MEIGFEIVKRVLVVTLKGEIDHHTCVKIRTEIDREFQRARAKDLVFDFKDVSFMDSSGIGMMMGRYRNVAICGGSVGVYNASKEVRKIMDMAGVCKLMKFYNDKIDAVDALEVLV